MKRIAALAVVVVLTGCSTADSKDIRTSGITANLVVTLPESTDAADVSASLRVGTLTFVELGDGEEITASGGGKSAELKHHRAAGVTDYTAIPVKFDSDPSELPSILTWDGECIQTGRLQLEPGRTSVAIPRGSIRPTAATPTPGRASSNCPVDLTLTRRTDGTLDKAFKNGSVTAESQSVRRIISAP